MQEGDLTAALDQAERVRARALRDQLLAGGADLRAGIAPEQLDRLVLRERESLARQRHAQQQLEQRKTQLAHGDAAALAALVPLQDEVVAAQRALDAVDDEVKLHSPAWTRALRASPQPLDLHSVRTHLLRPDEALMLYQIGPRGSFLFVLPAQGPLTSFRLEVDSDVATVLGVAPGPLSEQSVAELLRGPAGDAAPLTLAGLMAPTRGVGRMTSAAPTAGDTPAASAVSAASASQASVVPRVLRDSAQLPLPERMAALRRVLVPDAAWERIAHCREVVLVPDGALHLLPFEALVVRPAAAGRAPRWWLDEGPVVRYANSIATALTLEQRAADGGGACATTSAPRVGKVVTLCDPTFMPWQSLGGVVPPALPGTRRESDAAVRVFGASSVRRLEGAGASKAQLIAAARGACLLHLATHAFVDESAESPFAALVLAPAGAGDDGLLRLEDVYALGLHCDLAVLSACDTRAGQRVRGEGVFALARAFQAAGALRTVASLWAVADESTALLVEQFFDRVAHAQRAGGRVDFALALRDAKRTLRADPRYDHPIFWAPLVFSGAR